ncbi:MAG: MFS transporter [Beijerinckiaceae bacterium]|nr:MFS transporter [Beijerinckiaceae bacterium]
MNAIPDASQQVDVDAKPVLDPRDVRSIMIGLMTAMMLSALDTTIVAPAMPTIARELGGIEYLPWIVTAYLLVSTAMTPLYGKIADIKGRRVVIMFALFAFLAGSIACALAPTMLTLALARGLQGLGGAGIFAMTQTIIGDIVPPRERPRYQLYTSTVWMIANLAGPVLGGVFADYTHWSMIFWVNVPIGLLAIWLVSDRLKKIPRYERPHSIDVLGVGLMMIASTTLLLGLSWGGQTYPWSSAPMLAIFACSLTAWALLVWRQMSAAEPLIPLSVLRNQVALTSTMTMFFMLGGYLALNIYLPVYFQTLAGMSASQSGAALIPLLVFTSAGAWVASRLMPTTKHYKRLPLGGLLASAIAAFAMALWPQMPVWGVLIATTVIATGTGTLFPVVSVCVQAATPRHLLGSTMSLAYFFRSLGAAIMIALFGAILLGGSGLGVEAISHGGVPEGLDRSALAASFTICFALAGALFLVAAAFFAMMEERPLFGEPPASV